MDQLNLYFQEVGQGKPVVILHGLFGSSDNWRTLSLKLSQDFLVYSIDLRNHGRSSHSDDHSYAAMARDVYNFAEREELESFILIGHSMGAKVAMHFAFLYPSLVSKLVLVDMAPRAYPAQHSKELAALQSIDLSQVRNRRMVEELLGQQLEDRAVVQFFMKNLNRKNDDTFSWRFNLDVLVAQYDQILAEVPEHAQLDLPVLVVKGELSEYVSPEDEQHYKRLFRNVHFETVEGSGHWVHAEKPEEFLLALQDFLYTSYEST